MARTCKYFNNASLILVAGEDEEETGPHLLVDLQLGVLQVGPADTAGVILALEASLQTTLAEGVRAGGGDWLGDKRHTKLALKDFLHKVHELLPGVELLGLDLPPEPLVDLVAGHGLQDVGRDLELGHRGLLLPLGLGLLPLPNLV